MKECPECQALLEDAYLYCSRCGTNLQIPRCTHCKKELPAEAAFCPWCGKSVTAASQQTLPHQLPEKADSAAVTMPNVFSEDQQAVLKQLLGHSGATCTPEKVFWKAETDCWGALTDGTWTEVECMSATPAGPDWQEHMDAIPPARRFEKSMDPSVKAIAERSDECLHYEELKPYFTSIKHLRNDGSVWWEQEVYMEKHIRMVVSNPGGIGIDVFVEYMHYDDNF